MLTAFDMLLLVVAGFAGGTVNAIAGGATFFTFPAMLAAGVPPVAANASNTAALFPASIAAAWAQRRELADVKSHLLPLMGLGLAGGVGGAVLLLSTSDRAFMQLVPYLLLLATLIFALSPRILAWSRRHTPAGAGFRLTAWTLPLILLCAIYGGYFGAGLGIMLLAGLTLAGLEVLPVANALKNALSALINAVAVVVFVLKGIVVWPAALVMLVGAVAGGFTGARIARKLPVKVFRAIVIGVGSLLTVWYFVRP